MHKTHWLLLTGIGFSSLSFAADIKPQVATTPHVELTAQEYLQQTICDAITRFEQRSRKDWSFRITRHEDEEGDVTSSIEHFDPSKAENEQWSLLRSNGQAPTKKQIRKFVKSKQKGSKDEGGQDFSVKLSDIIQTRSLQIISEDAAQINASFNVSLTQLGEEATKHLRGSLTYLKDKQYIERIEITNIAPFSPMFSAKITDFTLTFTFLKIDTSILPHRNDLSMKGRFAFFTEIDEVSKDVFSDYKYVGLKNNAEY